MKALTSCTFVVLAGALALGCGPKSDKAFVARMSAAESARPDVDKAVSLYDEAAHNAPRAGDALLAQEAAATLLERAGRVNEADARWVAIATDSRASAFDKGAATLRLVGLRAASENERATQEIAWVKANPAHPAAPKVVRERMLALDDDDARMSLANDILAAPGTGPVAPWLRMEKARIAARAGKLADAVDQLESLANDDPYPKGVLFDDAIDEGSLLALRLGDEAHALRLVERATSERESSWIVGSANRPRFPVIFLRRARLQRTPDAAMAAYREMLNALPEARETGEARFELGVLEAAQGHSAEACTLARELQTRDEKRLVAKCAARFCSAIAIEKPSAETCAVLTERANDDRKGLPRPGLDR